MTPRQNAFTRLPYDPHMRALHVQPEHALHTLRERETSPSTPAADPSEVTGASAASGSTGAPEDDWEAAWTA